MRKGLSVFAGLLILSGLTVSGQYSPRNATPPIPPASAPPGASSFNPAGQSSTPLPADLTPAATNSTPAASGTNAQKDVVMPLSMDKIDNKRLLNVGDVINYRVLEDRERPLSLPVNDSGDVEVPLIGRVHAAGKTLRGLADEIKVLLERDYYYQATVLLSMDLMTRAPRGKVYVVGQVRAAGGQDIPSDENFTVSKAILRAGGFSDFADKRKVKLVRKKTVETKNNAEGKEPDAKVETDTKIIDCVEIFEKGDTSKDPVVQADDLIIIPQRLVNF